MFPFHSQFILHYGFCLESNFPVHSHYILNTYEFCVHSHYTLSKFRFSQFIPNLIEMFCIFSAHSSLRSVFLYISTLRFLQVHLRTRFSIAFFITFFFLLFTFIIANGTLNAPRNMCICCI